MSEKRKDNKGRVLRNGETQRSDGQYMYRYTDLSGKRKTVYSWKLVGSDRTPSGKRDVTALRDLEKAIQKDLEDGIDTSEADTVTLNDLFKLLVGEKCTLKLSTKTTYVYRYNKHVKEVLGNKKISKLKASDIIALYVHMVKDTGLVPCSVNSTHIIINRLLNEAVKTRLIRYNFAKDAWFEFGKIYDVEPKKRHALTAEEQSIFINYIYSTNKFAHWRSLFTFLLGTGTRIGEALGLQWEDCDFKNNIIYINKALQYGDTGSFKECGYIMTTPKTKSSTRAIPMLSDVKESLLEWHNYLDKMNYPAYNVGGYSNFVFVNKKGHPTCSSYIHMTLKEIVTSYNEQESLLAEQENREPKLLPNICAHMLRHTFCTRLCEKCESVSDIKVMQEVLGHRSFKTTMDIYSEATKDVKLLNFSKLDGQIKLR